MQPQMICLYLTPDEANALAKLIDAAVRASGIEAAKVALPLFVKLEEAAQAAAANQQEEPSPCP
jgi:hypothetical protein